MSFIKKYILFHLLIFLALLFIIFFIYDDKDACLDSAYCKEGLPLNIEGKKIIVNEQTCLENSGTWYQDKKICHFK